MLIRLWDYYIQVVTYKDGKLNMIGCPMGTGITDVYVLENGYLMGYDESHAGRETFVVYSIDDKDHDGYDRGSFSYWWKDESTGVEEDKYTSNVGRSSDKEIEKERYYELVQIYWQMIIAVQWYYID